ncbi:MAG TPA: hypothetical protein GX392_03525 [Clostridiales bacterium]|nr:hypothetical protein [Clostridiales bacterium]
MKIEKKADVLSWDEDAFNKIPDTTLLNCDYLVIGNTKYDIVKTYHSVDDKLVIEVKEIQQFA